MRALTCFLSEWCFMKWRPEKYPSKARVQGKSVERSCTQRQYQHRNAIRTFRRKSNLWSTRRWKKTSACGTNMPRISLLTCDDSSGTSKQEKSPDHLPRSCQGAEVYGWLFYWLPASWS